MKEDYELGNSLPSKSIRHLKRYTIYVKSDAETPAETLRFEIHGYTEKDRDGSGGTPIASLKEAYDLIDDFVKDDKLSASFVHVDTPIDFSLEEECLVALKLHGEFWEFANLPHSIKTKDDHSDDRYYYLRPHTRAGRVAAVSFCSKPPLKDIDHRINLYVDFIQDNRRLPVLIDPDIENKGKN